MTRTLGLFVIIALLAGTLSADTVETLFFRADLSTANEVPPVTGVDASGRALIALHVQRNDAGAVVSGVVDFDVDTSFAEAVTVTGLHIHEAPFGVNGAVVISSGLSGSNTVEAQGSGNLFLQVNADSGDALAALIGILANPDNFYVNLHTISHPAGNIRGQLTQIETLVLRSLLDPASEVPPVAGLDAKGSGSLYILATRNAAGSIAAGTVMFDISYMFPGMASFTGLHIHSGIAGVSGPVVISSGLSAADNEGSESGTGTISRKVEVTSGTALETLNSLFSDPSGFYLNLHTTVNPGGAIRGQLQATSETSVQVTMTPDQEVPPVTGLEASGLAKFSVHVTRDAMGEVDSGTAVFDVNYRFPSSTEFS